MSPSTSISTRKGLTLIELLIVLVILASVAGLVIPAVAMIGRTSDMAVSAKTQADLFNNIQQHFVLQKRYPVGMDSLMVSDGLVAATGLYLPVVAELDGTGTKTGNYIQVNAATSAATYDANDQLNGLPCAGPNLWRSLRVVTLTANQRRSIERGGLETIFDHYQTTNPAQADAAATPTNSNNASVMRRNLTASLAFAGLTNGATAVVQADALAMLRQIAPRDFTYPADGSASIHLPEAGSQIVAFGLSSKNSMVGSTAGNAPIYPGADGKYYGRYVAYFKVFETGERAILLGVSDSYGRLPDYTQGQFTESLPNGGRKG
jgi:prepilin-type N-terminal cleavage/methylation domain-containing protein